MSDERNCANCACVYKTEKPKLIPPGVSAKEWDAIPNETWVCRLEPPFVIQGPHGPVLAQAATAPGLVCWSWRAPKTLPGDANPV